MSETTHERSATRSSEGHVAIAPAPQPARAAARARRLGRIFQRPAQTMHELSVAQGILDLVQHYVPEGQAPDVRAVTVRVGALSGIVADSLEFCFSAIVAGTSQRLNARRWTVLLQEAQSMSAAARSSARERKGGRARWIVRFIPSCILRCCGRK